MNWWYYWLVVPAILGTLGVAGMRLSVRTMRPYRRLEQGMRDIAQARGARFRHPTSGCLTVPAWALSVTPRLSIVEERDGVTVVLAYDEERFGNMVCVNLVCAARKTQPGGPVFGVRPREMLDAVRRALGSEEVAFDDPAFTREFVVTADEPAAVRDLLAAGVRKVLRDTLVGAELQCDAETVVLKLPSGIVDDLWKADAALDLVFHLATASAPTGAL